MDLRAELLEAVADLEVDGWKVISIEAVRELIRGYDEDQRRVTAAMLARTSGRDAW